MRSRTKAGIVASVAATALLTLGTAAPSFASSGAVAALDTAEQADLAAFWTEQGVAASTQADLLDGINAGVLPQSVVGGASPTTETTTDEVGTVTTIQTYPDGSVSVSSTETPYDFDEADGVTAPRAITGCESQIGSGYANRNNCNVSGTNGVVTLGFIASYTLAQGGNDQITNHHTPIVACLPGTCSDPGFTQVVLNETAYSNAGITATTVYSAADYGSITHILNFEVGGDSASTSFSPLELP